MKMRLASPEHINKYPATLRPALTVIALVGAFAAACVLPVTTVGAVASIWLIAVHFLSMNVIVELTVLIILAFIPLYVHYRLVMRYCKGYATWRKQGVLAIDLLAVSIGGVVGLLNGVVVVALVFYISQLSPSPLP